MKKMFYVIMVAVLALQFANTAAARDKIFFGKNKGKEILSEREVAESQRQQQLDMLAEIKTEMEETRKLQEKTNILLEKLLVELKRQTTQNAQANSGDRNTLLREFIEVIRKQNELLGIGQSEN